MRIWLWLLAFAASGSLVIAVYYLPSSPPLFEEIEVRVVAEDGTPAPLQPIILRHLDGDMHPFGVYFSQTDDQGIAPFNDIPSGRYALMIPAPGKHICLEEVIFAGDKSMETVFLAQFIAACE